MKKAYISSAIFIGLFCLASSVLAQIQIPNPLGANSFGELLAQIAYAVGIFIATLGTIMIIVAGILYLTSAGSPQRMGTAKQALIYAIIGIVIGIAASTIVSIILEILNGAGP